MLPRFPSGDSVLSKHVPIHRVPEPEMAAIIATNFWFFFNLFGLFGLSRQCRIILRLFGQRRIILRLFGQHRIILRLFRQRRILLRLFGQGRLIFGLLGRFGMGQILAIRDMTGILVILTPLAPGAVVLVGVEQLPVRKPFQAYWTCVLQWKIMEY